MLKAQQGYRSSIPALILAGFLVVSCGPGGGNSGDGAAAGSSTVFLLNKIEWGRLVNVVDLNGVSIKTNKVVEQEIQTDATYELTSNALTDQATLRVKFATGTSAFATAYAALDDALPELEIKGPIGFGGQPSTHPFPTLPRNAALKLTFNNNINAATIGSGTVQLFQGSPAITPFPYRALHDTSNEANVLVLDPTVSQYEADQEGLQANSIGFPQGVSTLVYNVKLAIPGENSSSIFGVLRDVFGHGLTAQTTDPVEAGSIVRVFRTAIAGDSVAEFLSDSTTPRIVGQQKVSISAVATTGSKKRLTYSYQLTSTSGSVDTLDEGICWFKPGVGDIFVQGNAFGVVLSSGDEAPSGVGSCNPTSPNNSSCFAVDVTVLAGTFTTGTATTRHLYVDANDASRTLCFLDYSTAPSFISLTGSSAVGINADASISLHFSKPMNPSTILANDDIILGNRLVSDPANPPDGTAGVGTNYYGLNTGPTGLSSLVPFEINPSFDQKTFTVNPVNSLRNDGSVSDCGSTPTGSSGLATNCFYLHLALGGAGPRDLAGNPLPIASGSATTPFFFSAFRIHPQTTTTSVSSNGIALRFNTGPLSEDGVVGNSVVGGQFFAGSTPGQISGRPVKHFSSVCDKGVIPNPNAVLEFMALAGSNGTSPNGGPVTDPVSNGMRPPLVPDGARVQYIYRYFDLGFTIGDTDFDRRVDDFSFYNLDVEGANWSPPSNVVLPDRFNQISITLGHSQFVPDEFITPCFAPTPVLCYKDSGLGGSAPLPPFANNFFETANSTSLEVSTDFGPKNVFFGTYLIDPLKKFQYPATGQANTILMPWPDFQDTFVWRDTRLVSGNSGTMIYGGPFANGTDPDIFCNANLYTDAAGNIDTGCVACLTAPCFANEINTPAVAGPPPVPAAWANDPAGGRSPGSKISDFVPQNYPPGVGQTLIATVPTIGLPLLFDVKVQPDSQAIGNNQLRGWEANYGSVSLTFTGGNGFFLYPRFRMLSAGGDFQSGAAPVTIFPDSELTPRGEAITGSLGAFSDTGDDVIYAGQIDFVTKTSVVFTRWFDTGTTSPSYTKAIFEPTASEFLPLGLEVELAFRGGAGSLNAVESNGLNMDPYGNFPTGNGIQASTGWKTDISDIDGSRFFQVRVTFKGNATANLAAWLTGLQVAWTE